MVIREDQTCGCGLYIHPSRVDPKAIHIDDCWWKPHQHKFTFNGGTMCICGKTRGLR